MAKFFRWKIIKILECWYFTNNRRFITKFTHYVDKSAKK